MTDPNVIRETLLDARNFFAGMATDDVRGVCDDALAALDALERERDGAVAYGKERNARLTTAGADLAAAEAALAEAERDLATAGADATHETYLRQATEAALAEAQRQIQEVAATDNLRDFLRAAGRADLADDVQRGIDAEAALAEAREDAEASAKLAFEANEGEKQLEAALAEAREALDEYRELAASYRAGAALAYRREATIRELLAILQEYDQALERERHTSSGLTSMDYADLCHRSLDIRATLASEGGEETLTEPEQVAGGRRDSHDTLRADAPPGSVSASVRGGKEQR